jgi:hypothetical protein
LFDQYLELPHKIISGFILRKPSDRERDFISTMMHHSNTLPSPADLYEMKIHFSSNLGMSRESDPTKWRYYVIQYPHEDDDAIKTHDVHRKYRMTNFRLAALVSDARFQWGYESGPDPDPKFYFPRGHSDIVNIFADYLRTKLMREKKVPILTATQIEDVKRIFDVFDSLTDEQMFILRAYQLYGTSQGLNVNSDFRILALFAIIEFLITHKPNANAGDSLTRQIKGKLPLLCRRFDAPYPPEQFFPRADNTWEILYAYRSAIAHGNSIDFKSPYKKDGKGGFLELNNSQDVFFFLDEFVRRLLRHAIIEPQLCLDLKKC